MSDLVMTDEVRQVLVGMKSELSRGWIQNNLSRHDGVCLYGAVFRVCNIPGEPSDGRSDVKSRSGGNVKYTWCWDEPEGIAIKLLAKQAGVSWDELAVWNDMEGRTQAEVVGLIDKTLMRHAPKGRIRKAAALLASLIS